MKIAFYKMGLQHSTINSLFGGMYRSFFSALAKVDTFEVVLTTNPKDLNIYDVLVVPMGDGQERESCEAMLAFKGPIILYVQPAKQWFKSSLLKHWRDQIAFVYSTDVSTYSQKMYESINIQYRHFPFGSDQSVFYPLSNQRIFDVLFIGNASSGTGRDKYIQQLVKKAKTKQWKIMLIGSGWESYGFPYSVIPHGSLLNILYNSAKVCVNISNDEQIAGKGICLDANNRLFDLAMAGCCQISNGKHLVNHYFESDEVPTADAVTAWVSLIEKYLRNPKLNVDTARRAHKRAQSDHSWDSRATEFITFIEESDVKKCRVSITVTTQLLRYLDATLPPIDYYYKIAALGIKALKKKYVTA